MAGRRKLSGVREVRPDEYVITSEPRPKGRAERFWRSLRAVALGPAIPSSAEKHERLNTATGLAILGADNIASSVYGPEEMMRALAMAGTGALFLATPLGAAIVGMLVILAISYQQTIRAYPSGAGGYIVATANLGALVGLVCAAALMIDYSLDVAVSIASGIQSVTSAVAGLAGGRLPLAFGVLALLTLANLRGIRTSGFVFAVPIYVYILAALGVLALGFAHWAMGSLPPYEPPPAAAQELSSASAGIGLFLVLRAFASGAVALTGVEAVSNGVPYFKPPEADRARRTLILMAIVFSMLFLGISILGAQLKVVADPTEVETVISQLARTLMGVGPYYYVLQGATFLLLVLAADTGFADFPRLLSLLAQDNVLPEQFAFRGRRLAFGNGIVLVAILAAMVMFIFHASVSGLVPLFAIGAFTTFTLSQAGMALHWWRHQEPRWQLRLAINAFGALVTAATLLVEVVGKFTEGAWLVLVIMPLLVLALKATGGHIKRTRRAVAVRSATHVDGQFHHHVLIPVSELNKAVLHAIAYTSSLCNTHPSRHCRRGVPDVQAVYVTDQEKQAEELRDKWDKLDPGVPLLILESPYRALVPTVLRYIDELQAEHEDQETIVTVLLPETVPRHWWQQFLHNTIPLQLKGALLFRKGTAVTSVPYQVSG